jgi:uncharacterized membrane protein
MSEQTNLHQNPNAFSEKASELETKLISVKAKLRADLRDSKIYLTVAIIGAVFIVLNYTKTLQLESWLLISIFILAIFFLLAYLGTDTSKSQGEIEQIQAIKRIYLGFPEPNDSKPEYFDSLVKINVDNLAAYYLLVKTHTSQSFRVSITISVIGFILIAIGLSIGFNSQQKTIGYISTASGVLVEFISGALFYLYNKTVRQLKEYHDSLIGVQNVLLSFKLIESTTDEKAKADMITKMIEFLVQKK